MNVDKRTSGRGRGLYENATDAYVKRLPSPPRVSIPPLLVPGSLATLAKDIVLDQEGNTNWQYSHREQAQAILPWLYLGPVKSARSRDFLEQTSITLVVNIRQDSCNPNLRRTPLAISVPEQMGIQAELITVKDTQSLAAQFESTSRLISEHLERKRSETPTGKVLVCCESGNDRSAAIAAAYLVDALKISLIEAGQLLQYRRFSVNLDESLKGVLQAYEQYSIARREVSASNGNAAHQAPFPAKAGTGLKRKSLKRSAREDDDDIDMCSGQDHLSASYRAFSPFVND